MGCPKIIPQWFMLTIPPVFGHDHKTPSVPAAGIVEAMNLDTDCVTGRRLAIAMPRPTNPGNLPGCGIRTGLCRGTDRLPCEHEAAVADTGHGRRIDTVRGKIVCMMTSYRQ